MSDKDVTVKMRWTSDIHFPLRNHRVFSLWNETCQDLEKWKVKKSDRGQRTGKQ